MPAISKKRTDSKPVSRAGRARRLYQHISENGNELSVSRQKPVIGNIYPGEVIHVYVHELSYDERRTPRGRRASSRHK
jgi:hypothetical protein